MLKIFQEHSMMNCIICGETFEEDWIQCGICKGWAHENCADLEDSKRRFHSARENVLKQLSVADNRNKRRRFKAYLQECRFDLVQDVFLELGAKEVEFRSCWIVAWVDGSIQMETFTRMKPYQKINHFPGMNEICKKDLLAYNLKKMKKILPHEYNFFPLTFCLPDEARLLSEYCQKCKKRDIFIIKPDTNCQGVGIDIVKGIQDVKQYRNVVCQKYITTPLLMNNFKLDLRLYVLVTSINPLRVYLFNEGLVRLATVPYKKPSLSNLHETRMHLTNYAVNRNSKEGENWRGEESCKKSFAELESYLDSMKIEHNHLWPTIDRIIVKTILSALPSLEHVFHASFPMQTAMCPCFEILGFDVLLNDKVKPYLLEVNRSPSMGGSCAMDKELKRCVVRNTLEMILPTTRQISLINEEQHRKAVRRLTNINNIKHLTAKERILSEYQEKREKVKMGNFRQLYPVEDGSYDSVVMAMSSSQKKQETDNRELHANKISSESSYDSTCA